MPKAASTALDPQQERALRVQEKGSALRSFFEACGFPVEQGEGAGDPLASLEAQLDIALRLAEAGTIEEMFAPQGTLDGRDLVDRYFKVASVPTVRKSSFKGGIGWYLGFDAEIMDEQGEISTKPVSCGALNVMTAMGRLHKEGRLLGFEGFLEEQATASGYTTLWLRPWAERAAPGERGRRAVAEAGDEAPY